MTVPGDATVDDVRASIADAMGHPGCRARVHVPGLAGEIAGAGAFRDHVPGPDPDANANAAPADPDGVFARLAVCGYARLRRKTRATHGASRPPDSPPRPPASGAPPPPGGSPGFRRRNYIREAPEEDDRRAGGPDPAAALDPLAVPVGGHRPKPALILPLSDDEGEVVVTGAREAREARRRRDSGVPTREGGSAAAAEELWSALDREAKAARRDADAETKNPPTFDPRLRTIAGGRAVPEAATAALVEAFMAEEAARRGKAADGSAKARRKAPRGPGASARRSKRAKPSRDEPEPECIGAEDASRDEAEPEAGAQDASDALDASGDGPNASGNRSNAPAPPDADALPAPLERLARLYEASARAAAFLASQRVRATWKHLEPLTRGAGVALGDLEAMAALAPGSASLSRRRALRRDEARDDGGVSGGGERASFGAGRGGDGGDEIDEILVDLTVPGTARVRLAAGVGGDNPAPPCDEDEGSPEPVNEPLATVLHGSRPGARTYDAGSSEDDVHEDAPRDAEGEKAARGCSKTPRGSKTARSRATRGPGARGFAARRTAAFRAELATLAARARDHRSRASQKPDEAPANDPGGEEDRGGGTFEQESEREENEREKPKAPAAAGLDAYLAFAASERERRPPAAARTATRARPRLSPPAADAHPYGSAGVPGVPGGASSSPPPSASGRSRCRSCAPLDAAGFLAHLTEGPAALANVGGFGRCVAARVEIPARPGRVADARTLARVRDEALSPVTRAALLSAGVDAGRLYAHQCAGIEAALAGADVVVATGTASGKSAVYNATALERLFADPDASAIYLFPTKALARDQLDALGRMLEGAEAHRRRTGDARENNSRADGENGVGAAHPFALGVFDGDASESQRLHARDVARLVVTNPDMLHRSILPNHARWSRILRGLTLVVLDEAHVYRGVFGSHVALVVRRLRRVCREAYGAEPTFVVSSATIANPREHAEALAGTRRRVAGGEEEPKRSPRSGGGTTTRGALPERTSSSASESWVVVDEDASPRAGKTFLVWTPPTREAAQRARGKGKKKTTSTGGGGGEGGSGGERGGGGGGGAGVEPRVVEPRGKAAVAARLRAGAGAGTGAGTGTSDEHVPVPGALSGVPLPPPASVSARPGSSPGQERLSPIVETAYLLAECARHDFRCIAFCKTKKLCELVLRYARDHLAETGAGHLVATVRAYRGGLTPDARRETERELFSGRLRGVAATNALELGVDVGHLDATIHLGFPGSVASLLQQAGRAGRRVERRAVSVFVAFDGPLDAYFARRPERLLGQRGEFFDRGTRQAVDPGNLGVLTAHLECAAHEMPVDPRPEGVDATEYFGSAVPEIVAELRKNRRVARADPGAVGDADERVRWTGGGVVPAGDGPAASVSIRTIEDERYAIVDVGRDPPFLLEEVEASKAFWVAHPGAVYLNQGRTFLCVRLCLETRTASVRLADVKYFTRSIDSTVIELVHHAGAGAFAYPDRAPDGSEARVQGRGSSAQWAEAEVRTTFTGFYKVDARGGRGGARGGGKTGKSGGGTTEGTANRRGFDETDFRRDMGITLPTIRFRTVACWVRIPDAARGACRSLGLSFAAGAHAATHAVINALPLYVSVNPSDVAAECFDGRGARYAPRRLLIYDRHPGGVGAAKQAAPVFLEVLRAAAELIESCECRAEDREDPPGSVPGGDRPGGGGGGGEERPGDRPGDGDPGAGAGSPPGSPSPLGDEDAGSGCPGCCQYASCDAYNALLDARAGLVVLRATIAAEEGREVVGVEGGYEVQCCAGEGGCRGGRTDGGFVRE